MRLAALIFLISGSLFTNQLHAEEALPQPLTRADCDKAEMVWDENAHVCGSPQGVVAAEPAAAVGASQPLTRSACDLAGVTWDEQTHVCGESGGGEDQAAASEAISAASTIVINIDKTRQRMTVSVDGAEHYDWPVSTGLPGYATPSGSYSATSMNEMWYSREWDDAPMPHSVFFTKRGHAIHGTNEVKRLGKPASHGCVRLEPENAATLFDLVKQNGLENTDVVLVGTRQAARARWRVRRNPNLKVVVRREAAKFLNRKGRPEVTIGRDGAFSGAYSGVASPRGVANLVSASITRNASPPNRPKPAFPA